MDSGKGGKKSIALITGASSGLGREFALQIAQIPHVDELWILARRKDRLERLALELPKPTKVLAYDLTSVQSLMEIEGLLKKEQPNIAYLINNAGFGMYGPFSSSQGSRNNQLISTNITSLVEMTRLSLPFMSKGSSILQVASLASFVAIPKMNLYAASKSFVLSFSISLQLELRKMGIKVQALCPGPVDTEFSNVAREDSSYSTYGKKIKPAKVVERSLQDLRKNKFFSIYRFSWALVPWVLRFLSRRFSAWLCFKFQK